MRKTERQFIRNGEALFTHEGISGPAALTLSSLAARKDVDGSELVFDLKPALDADMLGQACSERFRRGQKIKIWETY